MECGARRPQDFASYELNTSCYCQLNGSEGRTPENCDPAPERNAPGCEAVSPLQSYAAQPSGCPVFRDPPATLHGWRPSTSSPVARLARGPAQPAATQAEGSGSAPTNA
jgi:hypothetical protein